MICEFFPSYHSSSFAHQIIAKTEREDNTSLQVPMNVYHEGGTEVALTCFLSTNYVLIRWFLSMFADEIQTPMTTQAKTPRNSLAIRWVEWCNMGRDCRNGIVMFNPIEHTIHTILNKILVIYYCIVACRVNLHMIGRWHERGRRRGGWWWACRTRPWVNCKWARAGQCERGSLRQRRRSRWWWWWVNTYLHDYPTP